MINDIGNAYLTTDLEILVTLQYYIYAAKSLNQSLTLVAVLYTVEPRYVELACFELLLISK